MNPDIEILPKHDKQIIQKYFKIGVDKDEDESQYWWFLVTKVTGNTAFENGIDDLNDILHPDFHDVLDNDLQETLRNNTLETNHLESVIPDNHVPDINNEKHGLRGSTLNQQAWVYSNCLVFVTHSKMFKINVHKLIENQRVMESSRTINDAV
jgi:hypothetical protein